MQALDSCTPQALWAERIERTLEPERAKNHLYLPLGYGPVAKDERFAAITDTDIVSEAG